MDMKLEVVTLRVSPGTPAAPGSPKGPGVDPERRSYASFATFKDPDENVWLLQEIRQRLPGR
jgi:hypothetical protein